ncbi:MAG: glucosaminidase domain-containing protein [Candidatus Caenarcaniphilales bacterium]|nr:glucosaminidase domain-containing protein [Candidatus Caenarcaniphilales bacterium]
MTTLTTIPDSDMIRVAQQAQRLTSPTTLQNPPSAASTGDSFVNSSSTLQKPIQLGFNPKTQESTSPIDTSNIANTNVKQFRPIDPAQLDSKLEGVLKGQGANFVSIGQKYNIDPAFLAAIAMLESGNGSSRAAKEANNVMGVMTGSGASQIKDFARVEDSVEYMAKELTDPQGYYSKANTIAEIHQIYAPEGANNDPNGTNGGWGQNVAKFYQEFLA